jgi:hypothetical protein
MPDIVSHPECQQAVSVIRLDQKLLEKDVHQLNIMGERLTDAVNKIQEMNSNLCALIKIHADKHEYHAKADEALDSDLHDMEKKIDILEKAFLAPRIETSEEKELKETIKNLERWKWMIIGGALALGFAFGQIPFDAITKLFH